MTPDSLTRHLPVSCETLTRLERYADLLRTAQAHTNLVGPKTLADLWQRHMLDSAQLWTLVPDAAEGTWLDMGAGAGFPGLVLAILGARHVHLVDSTAKKCAFLAEVARATGVHHRVSIHNQRLETLVGVRASHLTARACAPLKQLLAWGAHSQQAHARWWLLKGEQARREVAEAQQDWMFEHRLHPSRSDPRGQIVEAWAVQPR